MSDEFGFEVATADESPGLRKSSGLTKEQRTISAMKKKLEVMQRKLDKMDLRYKPDVR